MFSAHIATIGPEWLYHPLGECAGTHAEVIRCQSYNFHSGITGEFVYLGILVTAITGLYKLLRHLECHEPGCHRHGKYVIEGGIRCCNRHHPALDERPEDERGHIHDLHQRHLAHVAKTHARLAATAVEPSG